MPKRTTKYPPNTVIEVKPVEVFAVTFVDGDSVPDTRFVAMIGGDRLHMLHVENFDNKTKPPAGWLRDGVWKKIKNLIGFEKKEAIKPLPKVEVEPDSLPMG